MLNRLSSNRIIVTAQRSVSLESTKSTFLCPVCYENVDTLDRFIVQACGQEKHGCCQSCASIYFKGRISEGRLTELLCQSGLRKVAAVKMLELISKAGNALLPLAQRLQK